MILRSKFTGIYPFYSVSDPNRLENPTCSSKEPLFSQIWAHSSLEAQYDFYNWGLFTNRAVGYFRGLDRISPDAHDRS